MMKDYGRVFDFLEKLDDNLELFGYRCVDFLPIGGTNNWDLPIFLNHELPDIKIYLNLELNYSKIIFNLCDYLIAIDKEKSIISVRSIFFIEYVCEKLRTHGRVSFFCVDKKILFKIDLNGKNSILFKKKHHYENIKKILQSNGFVVV